MSMAGLDPTLSTSHPFYDVARHGILQVAGRLTVWSPRRTGIVFRGLQGRGLSRAASLKLGYRNEEHNENKRTHQYFPTATTMASVSRVLSGLLRVVPHLLKWLAASLSEDAVLCLSHGKRYP